MTLWHTTSRKTISTWEAKSRYDILRAQKSKPTGENNLHAAYYKPKTSAYFQLLFFRNRPKR